MNLREDARKIWDAAVAAADSEQAVQTALRVDGEELVVAGHRYSPDGDRRLTVVGAGKAGAGMAAGVERAVGDSVWRGRLQGWVNVPDDCLRPLQKIHLHPARPAGINEPTERAMRGTQEIVSLVSSCRPQDVCLVLISGGGSALLCSPVPGIPLADKLQMTRALSRAGATIQELNHVRTHLSLVKGGGLARACTANALAALVISDVLGDPPETIASGPVTGSNPDPQAAMRILQRYLQPEQIPPTIMQVLAGEHPRQPVADVSYTIVAANQMSLAAAKRTARRLGYATQVQTEPLQGDAAAAGRTFFRSLQQQPASCDRPLCLLAGGETTVDLSDAGQAAGKGGRNQEFVLAAAAAAPSGNLWSGKLLLSGGTDGEDGPTDAAGAFFDETLLRAVAASEIPADDYLRRHDAWNFFAGIGGLLRTGPTHTNVMDIAVGLSVPGNVSAEAGG